MGKYDPAAVFAGYRLAAVSVADTGRELVEAEPDAEPVEVGVTVFDGGVVGQTRTWLVRPCRPITVWASRAHGIGDADVADAPTVGEVVGQIRDVLGDRVVVAVRAVHLHGMLAAAVPGWCPPRVLDLARVSVHTWPWSSQALGALVLQARVSTAGRLGRAAHDAPATAAVFLAMARRLGWSAERVFASATVRLAEGQPR